MKALRRTTLLVATLGALLGSACGDSGSKDNDNGGGNTGNTAGNTVDGGGSANGGNTGTATGANTGATNTGSTNNGGTAGDGGATGGLPDSKTCTSKSDSRPQGGCFAFYCGYTEADIKAKATAGGVCADMAGLSVTCDGQAVRKISSCGRVLTTAGQALVGNYDGFRTATKDCALKDDEVKKLSEGCFSCLLDSAVCAAQQCVDTCLNNDSPECDKCRQEKGCTPNFYTCGGLPDPLK